MPGYILVEQNQLVTHKPDGMQPHQQVYGLLDFLRELDEGEPAFRKFAQLRVIGLEEVLFASHPAESDFALAIHHRLQRASSALQTKLLSVQFVFTGSLKRGDKLWSEYRSVRLPVDLIWGSPLPEHDGRSNTFYPVTFHLSSQ